MFAARFIFAVPMLGLLASLPACEERLPTGVGTPDGGQSETGTNAPDADGGAMDARTDAPLDAAIDRGTTPDARFDSGVDTGVDTGVDSGVIDFDVTLPDGGVATAACRDLPGGSRPILIASGGSPVEFTARSVRLYWSRDCDSDSLRLEFAEETCLEPAGHFVRVSMSGDAIRRDRIPLGSSSFLSDVRITYERPLRLVDRVGRFACASSDSFISFVSIDDTRNSPITGNLMASVFDCAVTLGTVFNITGEFDETLMETYESICGPPE